MVAIEVDQLLSNCELYEHRCMENTNKLYKTVVKCDNKQQYMDVLVEEMLSTPEGCNVNSTMTPNQS